MYNAGPDLSFVGPVLDQNCLQRLAIGRLNCGSIVFLCVFVFVCVLCVRLCSMSFSRRVIGWTVIVAFYLRFLFYVVFIGYAD